MAERRVSWIISANIDKWSKNLDKASKRMDRFGKDVRKVGGTFSKYLTAPLMAFSGVALNTAANFEESMNRVAAISQATGTEFTKLEQTARDLGATTAFSASQAADGMSFLAQAGFKVNDIIGSMPAVLNLAAAAKMDLAEAADIASNIMTGFGMSTDQLGSAVDVMAKSMTSANTDVAQLGEAMKMVGPVASGFGVQFEETAAAVGFLSDAGLQASQAGTGLRRIMSVLSQQADQLGISVMDSAGNMLPLADIIEQIEKRGLSATDAMRIFGERGGPAMQVLLSRGSKAIREMTGELENAGGTAEKIADRQLQGFNGMLKQLGSAWEELQITFMSARGLESSTTILEHITRLLRSTTEWFKSLGEEAQNAIINTVMALMTVGPAIVAVGFAISGLAIAIGALTSPITLTIGAIAGLAAAVVYVVENWDALIERVSDIGWWRNAIISMIQFWADYNPYRLIIKGYNTLLSALGMPEIPDPFKLMSDKLEDLKVETKEYEHQFLGFTDTILAAVRRWTGIDLSGMFTTNAIKQWEETAQKSLDAINLNVDLDITPPDPKKIEGAFNGINSYLNAVESRWEKFKNNFQEVGGSIKDFLANQMGNAIISFGEILGNSLAGAEKGWSTTFEKIILVVLDFAKSLARLAAGIGGVMLFIPGMQGQGIGLIAAAAALTTAVTAGQALLNKKADERQKSATSVNDALIRSDGSIVKFHPKDNILAMQDFGNLSAGVSSGGGGNAGGRSYIPINVNIDGRTVDTQLAELKYKRGR